MEFLKWYLLIGGIYQLILLIRINKWLRALREESCKDCFRRFLIKYLVVCVINALIFPIDILMRILRKVSPKFKDYDDKVNAEFIEEIF